MRTKLKILFKYIYIYLFHSSSFISIKITLKFVNTKKIYPLVKPTSYYFRGAIRESIWTIVPYNPCVLFIVRQFHCHDRLSQRILPHGIVEGPFLTLHDATSILSLLIRMDRSCKASKQAPRPSIPSPRSIFAPLFISSPSCAAIPRR